MLPIIVYVSQIKVPITITSFVTIYPLYLQQRDKSISFYQSFPSMTKNNLLSLVSCQPLMKTFSFNNSCLNPLLLPNLKLSICVFRAKKFNNVKYHPIAKNHLIIFNLQIQPNSTHSHNVHQFGWILTTTLNNTSKTPSLKKSYQN